MASVLFVGMEFKMEFRKYPARSDVVYCNFSLEYEIICGHPMAQMDFRLDVGSTGLSRWKSVE